MAPRRAANHSVDYHQTSSELLCLHCQHGQVIEGSQGQTVILCGVSENSSPTPLPFIVTKCSKQEDKQSARLYDTALSLRMDDGHAWVQQYVINRGHVWVRADTARGPAEDMIFQQWEVEDNPPPTLSYWQRLMRWLRREA
jgi:hypothetical protein